MFFAFTYVGFIESTTTPIPDTASVAVSITHSAASSMSTTFTITKQSPLLSIKESHSTSNNVLSTKLNVDILSQSKDTNSLIITDTTSTIDSSSSIINTTSHNTIPAAAGKEIISTMNILAITRASILLRMQCTSVYTSHDNVH